MTTAPVLDERVHHAALVAAIAAHEDDLPVYGYGKAPATLPPIFVMLAVERRYVEPYATSGLAGRSGWRALFRYVGTTIGEAQWAQFKVAEAIEAKRLTIGGVVSTPVAHESSTAPTEDEGRLSGRAEWTYAL